MTLKKDKQKVLGEFFDDERIRSFFIYESDDTEYADFHLLEKAYRGMIAENFSTFTTFFLEAKKDINAVNQYGETFLQTIKEHKQSEDYITALQKAGAH
ncbi:PA4642 family protein [Eionea flava]